MASVIEEVKAAQQLIHACPRLLWLLDHPALSLLRKRRLLAELFADEVISAIAEAHGVTSAQVVLRWNLQRGVVVNPGSSNPEHIRENQDIFGFELTEEEVEQISTLDIGEKHEWY